MPAIGGSIESVSLDGRNFSVAADADGQMKPGGKENEVQANGNGTTRLLQTQVPFELTGISVAIDDDAGDFEFLQALKNRKGYFPMSITLAGGQVWQGTGQITGDNGRSTASATMTLDLMGEGELTQQ